MSLRRRFRLPSPPARRQENRKILAERISRAYVRVRARARVCMCMRTRVRITTIDKERNFLPTREKEAPSQPPRVSIAIITASREEAVRLSSLGSPSVARAPSSAAHIRRPLLPPRFIKVSTADASCMHIIRTHLHRTCMCIVAQRTLA